MKRKPLYLISQYPNSMFNRAKARKLFEAIRKVRLPYAAACNVSRLDKEIKYPGLSLKEKVQEWRTEFKRSTPIYSSCMKIRREYMGRAFECEFKQGATEERKYALYNIRQKIINMRQEFHRNDDRLMRRKPNGVMLEFQTKRLRLPKRPVDKVDYVGIEVECVTPYDVDLTPLVPFSKWVDVGADGSINHKSNEIGTEVRICMRRDEVREVLPKIMQAIKSMGAYVNKSCGLHVHLDQRGNNAPEGTFQKLVRSLGLLYTVVPASRRRNKYCKRNRHADFNQAIHGDRYKAINASAFHRHNTIEVRLFGGTLEETKVINWIETLYAITSGQVVLRCPKTFDTALKYWNLSAENLKWLKERQVKFAELNSLAPVSESETEENQMILDENQPDDDESESCDCGDCDTCYQQEERAEERRLQIRREAERRVTIQSASLLDSRLWSIQNISPQAPLSFSGMQSAVEQLRPQIQNIDVLDEHRREV